MKRTKNLNCSFSIAGFLVLFSFTTCRWRLKNLSMAFCGAKVLQELLIRRIVWCHWFFSMSFELGKPSPLQKQTILCINTLSMLNVSLRLDFGGSWGRYSASSSGFEGHIFVGVVWCCLFGGCVPEHLAMYASLRPANWIMFVWLKFLKPEISCKTLDCKVGFCEGIYDSYTVFYCKRVGSVEKPSQSCFNSICWWLTPVYTHVAHGTLGQVCTRGVFFSTAQQDPFLQVAMQAELKTMDQKITTLLQWVQAGKVTGPQGY